MSEIIRSINIEMTDKCNLNCAYCFYKKRKKFRNVVNIGTLPLKNLEEICESKIHNVILTGGEPTLSQYFDETVVFFRYSKEITVLTNALTRINLPLEILRNINIGISLDGTFDIMNKHRYISTSQYDEIQKNITWYLENAKSVNINMVITKLNYALIYDYFENCSINYNLAYSVTPASCKFTPTNLALDNDCYPVIINQIQKICEENFYHVNIRHTVITKRQFVDYFSYENPIFFFPEFNMETNYFYYFNKSFRTIKELYDNYTIISRNITLKVLDYLNDKDDNFMFDAYSLCEYILFN